MEGQYILGRQGIEITLDDLIQAPRPYEMSYGFDLDPLCRSIKAIGLVNPPCIGRDEMGRIEVITGYRRILAIGTLGWSGVICEDVSSTLPSSRERLLFAFYENLATRAFNHIEKAMILSSLDQYIDKKDIVERFMPLLSLPCREETFGFYVELASMDHNFMDAVADGRLSVRAAESLMELKARPAKYALESIINLRLNLNQQMQFIDLLNDISEIKGENFSSFFERGPLAAILESNSLNTPQKAKKVLEELRSERYPLWKERERRFLKSLEQLSLPEGAKIDHPAYFEAEGYRLELHFKDGEDLMEKLGRLSLLSGLREFCDPVDDND